MLAFDGDQQNPILRGFMLPAIVREIFTGIFMRTGTIETIQGEDSELWFKWAEYVMEEPLPTDAFSDVDQISDEWMDWLDRLLVAFSAKKFNGKRTLLAAMEEHISD